MASEIIKIMMFLPTIKAGWDIIGETNFNIKDAAQIYDLTEDISSKPPLLEIV